MTKSDDSIYSIDKIEILTTKIYWKELEYNLTVGGLNKYCRDFLVIRTPRWATFNWFSARIVVSAPSNDYFKLLEAYDLGDYKITYIEIAKDEPRFSESEAIPESYDAYKHWRKRYTTKHYLCDKRDSSNSTTIEYENGLPSDMSGNLGSNGFKYALYARFSKITGEACIHSEWRIRGAARIRKRLGIETIKDCYVADLKGCYEQLTAQYITTERINRERLGRWICGWDRKRKFTRRQRLRVGVTAATFLSCISSKDRYCTVADLADWIKTEKFRIKSKPGPKTEWEKKILSIQKNSRFGDRI